MNNIALENVASLAHRSPAAARHVCQTISRPANLLTGLYRALLCACALALLAACGPTSVGEEPVAAAMRVFEEGHADKATSRLTAIIEREPANLRARYALGTVYLEARDAKNADEVLEKLEAMAGAPDVRAMRIRAWLMKGEYKRILDEIPGDGGKGSKVAPELLALRGHALFRVGHFTEAEATFKQAVALQPDLADAYMGLARLALWQSTLEEGKALAERALALYTKPPFEAWQTKGDIEQALGNTDAAVEAYGKALAIVPASVPVLINLAWVQIGAARYDRATENIESLRKHARGAVADYVQAVAAYRQGEYAKARDYAAVVARASPSHSESAYLAGAAAFKLKDYAGAARFLAGALDRAPGSLHIVTALIFAYARSNEIYEGMKLLRAVEKQVPNNRNFWAAAGELYLAAGDPAAAAKAFSRSLRSDPNNTELLALRGISNLSAGSIDPAIADLQASLQGGEPSLDVQTKLVLAYLRKKQPERAAAVIREIEAGRQDGSAALKLRAAVLMAQNDRAGALKLLEQAFASRTADPTLGVHIARMELDNDGSSAKTTGRLMEVLKRDPANLDALLALAALAQRDGDRQGRLRWLEEARKRNAAAPKPRLLLAQHYLAAGDAGKAIEYATEARQLAPDLPETLLVLGQAQMSAGKAGSATATFGRLLMLQPDSAEAHYRMGLAAFGSGSGPAAAQSYEQAIALEPKHAGAMFALGQYQLASTRYAESMRWARKLQESAASRHDGLILEGDTLFAQSSFAAASVAYRKAYAERKSRVAAAKSHAALKRAERAEEGEAILREYLADNAEDLATRLYLASALHQRRAYAPAIEQYEFIRQRQPKNALVLGNLADALHRTGDSRALALAQEAHRLAPDSADVRDTLGLIELERGRIERAVELLESATLIARDNPEMRYHLALALVKAGNTARAHAELKRALAAGQPSFADEASARRLFAELATALAQ